MRSRAAKGTTLLSRKQDWKPTQVVTKGTAAEHIFTDLREQILSARISRGSKLPTEKELAAAYKVSGATVREAMHGLATARLVHVRHGSGAYVTAQGDQLITSALHSMMQVERITVPQVISLYGAMICFAAELAATHATEGQLKRMEDALNALEEGSTVAILHSQLSTFLDTLGESSGNVLLATFCRLLAGVQLGLVDELSGGSYDTWRSATSQLAKDRRSLVAAIRARNVGRVQKAARLYNKRASEVISSLRAQSPNHPEDMHFTEILTRTLQRMSGPTTT